MNIIGISGSPRDKNTNYMLRTVLDATGKEYDLITLKDKDIKLCNACGGCFKSYKCVIKDDMQEMYGKLSKADIIVLGSPTYFDNVSTLMKIFIDRCLPFYFSEKLKGKKVALVSVGNFRKGEVDFLDNYNPDDAIKDSELKKEMEDTVKRCIDNMNNFCRAMKLKIVGSVFAINGDPSSVNNELLKLGQKLVET
ncbi:MAG: flavodoxin family protein [Candidatus Pacebacteria bacterium]|nr:flavodoxin family protein [Candidatus Paceibacterota bacterium]